MSLKFRNAAPLGVILLTAGVFSLGLSGQRKADAFPAYSKKENKPCSYCHVKAQAGAKTTQPVNGTRRTGYRLRATPRKKPPPSLAARQEPPHRQA